ncbi:MAG: 16S rRNA (guanine(966)-N(2))-methyltransferase RsmD [Candidatus Zixiibacteriota bacterium]
MRISGGQYHGRKIDAPPGLITRPTIDKVRQAIFNILMHDIDGATFLDLFAGSGAVGIEAVSRGAKSVIFVESGRKQVEIIQKNLKKVKLDANILDDDYKTASRILNSQKKQFDIVFADPPYLEISPLEVIDTVIEYDLLTPKGLLIIEHKFGALTENDKLKLLKKRKFGQTEISFFGRIPIENE